MFDLLLLALSVKLSMPLAQRTRKKGISGPPLGEDSAVRRLSPNREADLIFSGLPPLPGRMGMIIF